MRLDLDPTRAPAPPREAATLILVRDRLVKGRRELDGATGAAANSANADRGLEVFCVVRHAKSAFLGGAVVFPGGKVDAGDHDPAWADQATAAPRFDPGEDDAVARAYGVAVCREALEEAAILLTVGPPLGHDDVVAFQARANASATLRDALASRGLVLDLAALTPFGRWITPVAESRRFDTRFFLASAPAGQRGAHDAHETTASFWASPSEVLRRFDAAELELAPPTHRCLELLSRAGSAREAVALAASLGREPICPALVPMPGLPSDADGAVVLALPGDPEHEVREARVPGKSRFVLRSGRFQPESAPQPSKARPGPS